MVRVALTAGKVAATLLGLLPAGQTNQLLPEPHQFISIQVLTLIDTEGLALCHLEQEYPSSDDYRLPEFLRKTPSHSTSC